MSNDQQVNTAMESIIINRDSKCFSKRLQLEMMTGLQKLAIIAKVDNFLATIENEFQKSESKIRNHCSRLSG